MDAVILFSHGSVLCGSGEALLVHAERLREQDIAPIIEIGYLNYTAPPFATAVARCVSQGATRILVAPYFLVPGKFVKVDLPQAIAREAASYPDVSFHLGDAVGFDEALADALLESAACAMPPAQWWNALARASNHCLANPECPLYNTPSCKASTSSPRRCHMTANGPSPDATVLDRLPIERLVALLVLVHGSPRPAANADLYRVLEVVRNRGIFPIIEVGFLECNEPDIPTAIDICVAQGATEIIAVPYFLHTGTHVAEDLPHLLEEGRVRHPMIVFRMGDYIGRSTHLTDILSNRIRQSL